MLPLAVFSRESREGNLLKCNVRDSSGTNRERSVIRISNNDFDGANLLTLLRSEKHTHLLLLLFICGVIRYNEMTTSDAKMKLHWTLLCNFYTFSIRSTYVLALIWYLFIVANVHRYIVLVGGESIVESPQETLLIKLSGAVLLLQLVVTALPQVSLRKCLYAEFQVFDSARDVIVRKNTKIMSEITKLSFQFLGVTMTIGIAGIVSNIISKVICHRYDHKFQPGLLINALCTVPVTASCASALPFMLLDLKDICGYIDECSAMIRTDDDGGGLEENSPLSYSFYRRLGVLANLKDTAQFYNILALVFCGFVNSYSIVALIVTFNFAAEAAYSEVVYVICKFVRITVYLLFLLPHIAEVNDKARCLKAKLASSAFSVTKDGQRILNSMHCDPIKVTIGGYAFNSSDLTVQAGTYAISLLVTILQASIP